MRTECLPDPKECQGVLDGLLPERREKILRYAYVRDRKLGLAAEWLLKEVLQMHEKNEADITYGYNGKPEIDGLYFNLSHSHEVAVCAVSNSPVGCDVEKIDKAREKIATHFFTPQEMMHLNQFNGEKKDEEFYRLWTMKESYIKMTGEGMKLSFKRIEFQIGEAVHVFRDGKRCDCYIREYKLPGYKLTVCGQEHEFEENPFIRFPTTPRKKVLTKPYFGIRLYMVRKN